MKKYLQPWIARFISSSLLLNLKRTLHEVRRGVLGRPHKIDVFIRVDDPYSFLLLQVMPELHTRYPVRFSYHVVSHSQQEMYPEPELWATNAHNDARHIAELYQLKLADFSKEQSVEDYDQTCAYLISIAAGDDFLGKAIAALSNYWSGNAQLNTAVSKDSEWRKVISANEQLLDSMGHYLSASLHYAGEWYWGIDRLSHLERRLNQLVLKNSANSVVKYQENTKHFCKRIGNLENYSKRSDSPLVIYFSARSPYSYIGLIRALKLAKHYGVPTVIKPVLPMLMRGMNVPDRKKWYIFSDTKREALKLGLDYGFVADPLGAGVERCYALLDYAQSEGKMASYLLSFATAVNAEGIHADTDKGLQQIVEKADLSWSLSLIHI